MTALTFALKAPLHARVDVSALTPLNLDRKSAGEIERMVLQAGRERIKAADIFSIGGSDCSDIRFLGDCAGLDGIGAALNAGRILVEGNAGANAGRSMTGGLLTIAGNAAASAGAGLEGGVLKIEGNAGANAGGALPGRTSGMRGGFMLVRGNAGANAGQLMRRGMLAIEGDAGDYAGNRMIAGTIAVMGQTGAYPGYLMRRGSILLRDPSRLGATFLNAGLMEFEWLRILFRYLAAQGVRNAATLRIRARRYAGDMAALGKGEILALAS